MSEQSDYIKKKVKKILDKQAKMESDRSTFETHWQEAFDYIIPRKATVTTTGTPGEKRGAELFDTTAIMANIMLAGTLHGMLTNPALRFFDLVVTDPELNEDEEVQFWLQDSADRLFNIMNNSNFQTEIHEVYIDLGAIGNSCMFIGEDEKNVVHFSARPMKEIYIDESNKGFIDTVNRSFKWNARQIVQEFGKDKVPELVKKMYAEGKDDCLEIIHSVYPQDDEKPFFNYTSCYVLKESGLLLNEGGFPEMPYVIPMWTKVTGEKYGRGPGQDMLPDIKMVNKMMETVLRGAQKTVDPPLMVQDDGVIGMVRLTPGGLTVVRPGMEVPIRPLITDARIDFGYQAVEDVRKRIRAGFFVDKIQLNDGPQKTATEVNQIVEESYRFMGPVLGRQHYQNLRPMFARLFGIALRKGLLLPPPKALEGKDFDVRYSSTIAKAQRASEGMNLSRAFQTVAPIIQLAPEAVDLIDGDKMFKHGFDMNGVPKKLLRSEAEVKKIRKNRAMAQQQMIQQQQQAQAAEQVGQAVPALAQLQQAQGQKEGAQ